MSNKFTIKKGDYIDSSEFSREELQKFCELAVGCGFGRGYGANKDYQCITIDPVCNGIISVSGECVKKICKNNITTGFRQWLNEERKRLAELYLMQNAYEQGCVNVQVYPKSLLKDGMRCTMRNGTVVFVTGESMQTDIAVDGSSHICLDDYFDNLTCSATNCDIVLITDRDGTVVWERAEPLKVTLAEIAAKFNVDSVEITNE